MTSGAQMILKRSSNSSMSSKGPRSPHILKTSLKSSKRLQNVLKFPRSSVGPQILEALSMSPKILESHQKQIKVYRFPGPQFPESSWKDPLKVLKSIFKMSSKGSSKSSRCTESLQNVPKVLSSLNNPQKVIKVINVLKGSTKSSNSQKVLKVRKTSSNILKLRRSSVRSSNPRNVHQYPQSPRKVLNKVNSKSSDFQVHSSQKSAQMIVKRSSNVPQNVLKRSSKSSRGSESLQNVLKVLRSLNSPQ